MEKSWRILNLNSWKKRILILVNTNLELNEIKISVAKIRNLENWKDHSGYKEVDNEGQNTASADG